MTAPLTLHFEVYSQPQPRKTRTRWALESALELIAAAYGGDWDKAPDEWFHRHLPRWAHRPLCAYVERRLWGPVNKDAKDSLDGGQR